MKQAKHNLSKAHNIAFIALFIITAFWFLFSLVSGFEQGILGTIMMTLPWLLIFGALFLTKKKKLVGGVIFLLLGIGTIIFFDTSDAFIAFALISLPLLVLGGISLAHYLVLERKNQEKDRIETETKKSIKTPGKTIIKETTSQQKTAKVHKDSKKKTSKRRTNQKE